MIRRSRTPSAKTPAQKPKPTPVSAAPPRPDSGALVPQSTYASPISRTIRAGDFKVSYANHTRMGITQWDLHLIFGQTAEDSTGGVVVMEDTLVRFSPQYFKVFVETMTKALQQWETVFGEIPPGLGQDFRPQGLTDAFGKLREVLEGLGKMNGNGTGNGKAHGNGNGVYRS
jgi:hypothetical protein